ncbi:MAG TPA: hypothetical protein VKE51_41135 [Vicinamibacterales bacterium]|nr:hypothetical protein [Vicinamibacterales bacterium]
MNSRPIAIWLFCEIELEVGRADGPTSPARRAERGVDNPTLINQPKQCRPGGRVQHMMITSRALRAPRLVIADVLYQLSPESIQLQMNVAVSAADFERARRSSTPDEHDGEVFVVIAIEAVSTCASSLIQLCQGTFRE